MFVTGQRLLYENLSLRRSDGLTVDSISMGREKDETFLFNGRFGEFKIRASRWNEWTNKPTDIYIVYLFQPYMDETTMRLVRLLSKDIESALINFPVHAIFENIPVKDVVFQMSIATAKPSYYWQSEQTVRYNNWRAWIC